MFKPQELYDYVCQQWQEEILPSLCDYIKIPNKSPHFDAQWQEHGYMDKAVDHIAEWCKNHAPQGMKLDIMRLENRTPSSINSTDSSPTTLPLREVVIQN